MRPSKFVSLSVAWSSLPDVNYQVIGLGDEPREVNADQWGITAGVEGTFEYTLYGTVASPTKWKSYKCELTVNSLGSAFRADYEPMGYLGDGRCDKEEERIVLRLYVRPSIARDILDKIFVFDALNSFFDGERHFRFDLIDLRALNVPVSKGATIGYRIIRLYC